MRINIASEAMRGGQPSTDGGFRSDILHKKDGSLNWSLLRKFLEADIKAVEADSGSPGLVRRISIQIQKGAKR